MLCKWTCATTQTCWTRKYWLSAHISVGKSGPAWMATDLLLHWDFAKIILHKSYHTVIITVQRQEEKKNIRKGNEIRTKEQSNQNTLAVSPEGLAESGCILLAPGNPCPGTAPGRLPASSTTARIPAPSHPHITLRNAMFPKPRRADRKNGLFWNYSGIGSLFKWDFSFCMSLKSFSNSKKQTKKSDYEIQKPKSIDCIL